MTPKRVVLYFFILISLISLVFNYYLYLDKKHFEAEIGAGYLMTVRQTLIELDDTSSSWVKEFKKENSEVLLERHVGELRTISNQYSNMNGKIDIIGTHLKMIIDQLYELKEAVATNENTHELEEEINDNVFFINNLLKELEDEFGENGRLWYQELSNHNSKTSNEVWEQYKEYSESQN